MLYSVALFPAVQQCKSALSVCECIPSLPLPLCFPSRSSESTELSVPPAVYFTRGSVYMSIRPTFSPPPPLVATDPFSVCTSILALQIGSSAPFF